VRIASQTPYLRLQVVGGDPRAGDQDALLAFERLFLAAGEEERDVGVLLRLRDALLREPGLADDLGQDPPNLGRRIGDAEREVGAVLRHRHDLQRGPALAIEAVEVLEAERHADLAHAVRAIVEAQHDIAVLEATLRRIADRDGLDELVTDVTRVRALDRLLRAAGSLARAGHEQCVRALDTVPAVVAIHRPVATTDRRDASDARLGDGALEQAQVLRA